MVGMAKEPTGSGRLVPRTFKVSEALWERFGAAAADAGGRGAEMRRFIQESVERHEAAS